MLSRKLIIETVNGKAPKKFSILHWLRVTIKHIFWSITCATVSPTSPKLEITGTLSIGIGDSWPVHGTMYISLDTNIAVILLTDIKVPADASITDICRFRKYVDMNEVKLCPVISGSDYYFRTATAFINDNTAHM